MTLSKGPSQSGKRNQLHLCTLGLAGECHPHTIAAWSLFSAFHRCSTFFNKTGLALVLSSLFFALFLGACDSGRTVIPNRIIHDSVESGDHQMGPYGEILPIPLRAVVEGPVEPGLLGGKGSRSAVRNALVRFEVLGETGAVFADNNATEIDARADAAGLAKAQLRLGQRPGDVRIQAYLPEYPDVPPVWYRASAGVEVIGSELETTTDGSIDEIGVRLTRPDGEPASGVDVYFRVEGDADGAWLKSHRVITDQNGRAVTSWRLGSNVKQYFATAEIRDTRPGLPLEERFVVRAIEFTAMASNKTQMALVLVGGLAIFIFGMKMMSDGLQKVADRRLKQVLGFMTRNRFMALIAGTLITAMVQSSSATTVMAVGFVNAGLISLTQAIGVIFGANIGTTITAQIIAFRLDALSYPAITVGLVLVMFAKQPRRKAFGESILGFGLLFLGMTTMSDIIKPLRYSPEFVSYFQLFDCTPVNGGAIPAWPALMCILIGTVMTCLIQSSSATVGLVMALASQGLISFYTAVPLVLGDNIGTTITANMAAIGASRNAKRAAFAHTLFNVFGAFYMYALLFVPIWDGQPFFLGFVNAITAGEVFSEHPENLLRHVANAHTAFNLINCLLFLPFVTVLASICRKIIPVIDAEASDVLQYLEPNLLKTPSIALQQAVKEVNYMVHKAHRSVSESGQMFIEPQPGFEAKIIEREHVIDQLQHDIAEYLVLLSRTELSSEEAALMPLLLHAVNDAERLGDHAEELLEVYRLLLQYNLKMPPAELREIQAIREKLEDLFTAVYRIFEKHEESAGNDVKRIEANLQQMIKDFTDANVKRIDEGICDVQAGVIYLDALTHFERVAQHLLNIGERAVDMIRVVSS